MYLVLSYFLGYTLFVFIFFYVEVSRKRKFIFACLLNKKTKKKKKPVLQSGALHLLKCISYSKIVHVEDKLYFIWITKHLYAS